jgi:hypothetical protein
MKGTKLHSGPSPRSFMFFMTFMGNFVEICVT